MEPVPSPPKEPTTAEVRIEREGPVAIVLVDRPRHRNALARDTMVALGAAVAALAEMSELRCVVVAGGGECFIAGGDLQDLQALTTADEGAAMARRMQGVLDALAALPVPVIAAVDGFAIGGGAEVALAADLRVLGHDAWLAFRQADFAVSTAWGGAWRLTRLVGPSRALRLLTTGDRLDAREALHLGLADAVATPGERALDCARVLAHRLSLRPAHVLRTMKRLVDSAALPAAEHRVLEADLFGETWGHVDHHEAVARFLGRERTSPGEMKNPEGCFIVLEGIDGAGTTTQTRLLQRWLSRQGAPIHTTAEPSGGPIGVLLRQALGGRVLGRDGERFCPESIALLFAADRFDHLRTEIEPHLRAGTHVISDRYDHSSLAYQGLENDPRWVSTLNVGVRRPDLVLFLDVEPAVASRRRSGRASTPEIYEVDDLQVRIAAAYRDVERWRPSDRCVRIDGNASVRVVQRACRASIEALLGQRGRAPGSEVR